MVLIDVTSQDNEVFVEAADGRIELQDICLNQEHRG
jgi:hypothetical protein